MIFYFYCQFNLITIRNYIKNLFNRIKIIFSSVCHNMQREDWLKVPVINPETMEIPRVTASASNWYPACWYAVLLSPGDIP